MDLALSALRNELSASATESIILCATGALFPKIPADHVGASQQHNRLTCLQKTNGMLSPLVQQKKYVEFVQVSLLSSCNKNMSSPPVQQNL
jgi:hypothetical protein